MFPTLICTSAGACLCYKDEATEIVRREINRAASSISSVWLFKMAESDINIAEAYTKKIANIRAGVNTSTGSGALQTDQLLKEATRLRGKVILITGKRSTFKGIS